MSHIPGVCGPPVLAHSCPAEQGVQRAHTFSVVMSLTLCQKLCQLRHKGKTAPL